MTTPDDSTGSGSGSASPPSPQRHSVWGRVVTPAGVPLPTAEVFWVSAEHAGSDSVGLFDIHKVAQTDADGRFWAPGLPAGPGLLVPDFRRLGRAGDQVHIAHATSVTLPLREGEEVEVVFPHERKEFGSIHGVVKDPFDRRPASRLKVSLLDESGEETLRSATTGTNGSFSFEFLRPGTYRVALWGTRRHLPGSSVLELARNKRLDLKIDQARRPDGPRGSLRVRVEDSLGLPIAGARVTVQAPSMDLAPRTTDAEGCTLFEGLPVRPLAAMAIAPGHWLAGSGVPEGELTDPAEVVVRLDRTVQLRVGAVDATTGRALRHVNLLLTHLGGDVWVWGGDLPPPDAPPQEFRTFEVRPGPVTLRAESPDYAGVERALEIDAAHDGSPLILRLVPRRPEGTAPEA